MTATTYSRADFADLGDDATRAAFDNAQPHDPAADWPEPKALPAGLLPVAPFDSAMLPDTFRPWIEDIAERMQVPPEFAAVPAMIAAGSVIGNRIAIRPKRHDDWQEVPNLWGLIIGRPGVLKSPSYGQAIRPLGRLAADAEAAWEDAKKQWDADADIRDLKAEARKKAMRKALEKSPVADISALRGEVAEEPICRRYKTNDTGYQALGELLIQNPTGLLVERDELLSLLHALDREEASEARGFFLTAWNGADSYTFDRIGRGFNRHIPRVTVSMFGGTQPAKIAAYVRGVTHEGRGDDGLLQRFGMAVWPDMSPDWKDFDRYPDVEFKNRAFSTFARLDRLNAHDAGAEVDPMNPDGIPFLRFAPSALEIFREWRGGLERRLRSGELGPHLESHLAKYRKLVPALALISHLADGGTGPVGEVALVAALSWAEYLESHARRIYHAGTAGEVEGAKVILRNLQRGGLETTFKARDVSQRNWTPMGTNTARVKAALDLLTDYDWLREEEVRGGPGRPTIVYTANPRGLTR